jgi:hypothetical protein
LARSFVGEKVIPKRKIFINVKLQFRHSDNINIFLGWSRGVGLPEVR